ncbi:protein kinase superfamily protein [Anaeramoeba flamelloides]|uniref:non-specific serine/threonine protein kinase n=1 Tax=Anaeramoeba flamelloides TaxID=1746091 RepID=A0AAV7YZ05_9EUKA|nr:protein kinase superfamily protein [Anaeramoeba flamelloides]
MHKLKNKPKGNRKRNPKKRISLGSNQPREPNFQLKNQKSRSNDDLLLGYNKRQTQTHKNKVIKKKIANYGSIGLMGNPRIIRNGKVVVINRRSKTDVQQSPSNQLAKKQNNTHKTKHKHSNQKKLIKKIIFTNKTKKTIPKTKRKKVINSPSLKDKKKIKGIKQDMMRYSKSMANINFYESNRQTKNGKRQKVGKGKENVLVAQTNSNHHKNQKQKQKHILIQTQNQKQKKNQNNNKNQNQNQNHKQNQNQIQQQKQQQNDEHLFVFSDSDEQGDTNRQEDPQEYKKGGYHPTKPGEIFKKRYKAIMKLGWGFFSTVWLVEDIVYGGKLVRTKTGKIVKKEKYLALKIVKSSKAYSKISVDEIQILLKVTKEDTFENSNIVKLIDQFFHQGPNGKHICLVFEFLDQKNLLNLLDKYGHNGLPIDLIKVITKQILIGLDHLHSKCGIIHTDIKPENIMLYNRIGTIPSRYQKKFNKAMSTINKNANSRTENNIKHNNKSNSDQKNKPTTEKNTTKNNITENNKELDEENKQNITRIEENNESLCFDDFTDINNEINEEMKTYEIRNNDNRILKKLAKENIKKKTKTIKNNLLKLVRKEKRPTNENNQSNSNEMKLSSQMIKKIKCKIVDLGNACWEDRPYSSKIQTREYRSPEVILGQRYNCTVDIWSLGCLVFELLTGEILFAPNKGKTYSKDEDHLALIMETLGKIPKNMLLTGRNSKKYFDLKNGELKNIKTLDFWPLEKVLLEKYNFNPKNANEISNFLTPMFHYDINKRISAKECLQHPWLSFN